MARYGITAKRAFGVSAPVIRKIAADIGRDHVLAQDLWATGILEARTLAALVDDPASVTREQMESWALEFDSWAICDACCCHLFDRTRYAWQQPAEWCGREEEFVKRAGFVVIAALAVHDKGAADSRFERFLPVIRRESEDGRVYVRKAVNWALRQIGKRNEHLRRRAISTAEALRMRRSSAARWIAADALRELRGSGLIRRLRRRTHRHPAAPRR